MPVGAARSPKVPLLHDDVCGPLPLALHPLWLYRATEGVLGRGDQGANSEGQLTEGEAVHVPLGQPHRLGLLPKGIDRIDDPESARTPVGRGALDRAVHRRHR